MNSKHEKEKTEKEKSPYEVGYAKGWQDAKKVFKRPQSAWISQSAHEHDGVLWAQCYRCMEYGVVSGWCSNCGADMGGGDEE